MCFFVICIDIATRSSTSRGRRSACNITG